MEEVKTIFAETIVEWFKDNMKQINRVPLMTALWDSEEEKATMLLSELLFHTISYHNYKEDYYHAFLTGIFVGLGYETESDKEYGEGRPDIVVKDRKNRRVLLMEAKYSKSESAMQKDCEVAVNQIDMQQYAKAMLDGYKTVVCYGVVFYKKRCFIKKIEIMSK